MEKQSKLFYFLFGLGIGVASGLLLAPKSGRETRDLFQSKANEGKEYLRRRSEELRESAKEMLEDIGLPGNDPTEPKG